MRIVGDLNTQMAELATIKLRLAAARAAWSQERFDKVTKDYDRLSLRHAELSCLEPVDPRKVEHPHNWRLLKEAQAELAALGMAQKEIVRLERLAVRVRDDIHITVDQITDPDHE